MKALSTIVGSRRWVVSGNFNEVLMASKRDGFGVYSNTELAEFKEAIGNSHLTEM